MADFSDARIKMALFQKTAEERTSDRSPHASGNLEISVADLNEFFSLAMALKPVDNYKGDPVIRLSCAVWHSETRAGKPFESIWASPQKGSEFKQEDLATPHTKETPLVAATVVADDEEI